MALTRLACEEAVRHPGKFQGEAPYVPYLWDLVVSGEAGDFDDRSEYDGTVVFWIDDADREVFHELKYVERVTLKETNDGFVIEVRD